MEKTYIVLTAVGRDRVGLVDEISSFIEELRMNISDSRMAVLGGEFAVIMLLEADAGRADALIAEIEKFGPRLGLGMNAKRTSPPRRAETGRPYLIECSSLDAPGIVHAVSAVLHRFGANIEDLETETAAAPLSGAPMFRMRGRLVVPGGAAVPELRAALARLELERDLDVSIKPIA